LFAKSCSLCCFFNRLLDREQIGDEETSLDDEEEDGFLKAFKVFSF
jgi:chromodomain-helicase-DNA-binding protein 4